MAHAPASATVALAVLAGMLALTCGGGEPATPTPITAKPSPTTMPALVTDTPSPTTTPTPGTATPAMTVTGPLVVLSAMLDGTCQGRESWFGTRRVYALDTGTGKYWHVFDYKP